ncbi:unnamed protein product (macronuclear) [Paramecium tetraurelia]|uniref:RING-type domain-containing protein n=1 Tax=Paramecium tetraurelia TaxID=5888 RepID=A0BF84_PARTE|nr:uncharacterized protein GSPATT00028236001 [Paramecium tetraurelia]CAK57201.1 unnamed protein product [Paramecium tetraurelia]|eukprot:XP_001424599.1 hypothetical protein (macronuclear) [Paramecium tetraurelia strain d4-2]
MLINKLPLLEQTQSPKPSHKTKLHFENTSYLQGEKFYKQPLVQKQKRQLSIMKSQTEIKKQIQSITDDSVSKRMQQSKQQQEFQSVDKLQLEFESKYQEQNRTIEDLKLENIKLKMQLEEQEQQIIYLKIINSDLRQQIEISSTDIQIKRIEQEYKDTYRRMDETLRKAIDENYESQIKMKNLQIKSQQLEQFTFMFKQQLTCKFCRKELHNTITVIPCAHNYCQRCVSGYVGRCFACNDDV